MVKKELEAFKNLFAGAIYWGSALARYTLHDLKKEPITQQEMELLRKIGYRFDLPHLDLVLIGFDLKQTNQWLQECKEKLEKEEDLREVQLLQDVVDVFTVTNQEYVVEMKDKLGQLFLKNGDFGEELKQMVEDQNFIKLALNLDPRNEVDYVTINDLRQEVVCFNVGLGQFIDLLQKHSSVRFKFEKDLGVVKYITPLEMKKEVEKFMGVLNQTCFDDTRQALVFDCRVK